MTPNMNGACGSCGRFPCQGQQIGDQQLLTVYQQAPEDYQNLMDDGRQVPDHYEHLADNAQQPQLPVYQHHMDDGLQPPEDYGYFTNNAQQVLGDCLYPTNNVQQVHQDSEDLTNNGQTYPAPVYQHHMDDGLQPLPPLAGPPSSNLYPASPGMGCANFASPQVGNPSNGINPGLPANSAPDNAASPDEGPSQGQHLCPHCGREFTKQRNCDRHRKSVCTAEGRIPSLVPCIHPGCARTFKRRYDMKKHYEREHQK